jgi:hypothetical protein
LRKIYPDLSKTVVLTLILVLLSIFLVQSASSQVDSNTIVRTQPSTSTPQVGETFTVSIIIENVQNLYGIDLALSWNDTVLQFQSADLRLGVESHPDGVLHEDSNTEIYIVENEALKAEYQLVATSVGPASSFNGSGTIININFKAITIGHSALDLETELADRQLGGTSMDIEHTDVDGSIESTENGVIEPTNTNWLTPIIIVLIIVALILVATALIYFRKRPTKKPAQQI